VKAAAIALVLAIRVAHAYPQFQLSKDPTCTSCHISPAGGLLLNENGLAVAETMSTFGGAPEAGHGLLVGPSWLEVGGDGRLAGGVNYNLGAKGAVFPMQADFDAAVRGYNLTLFAMIGAQSGNSRQPQTYVATREHWLMWQPDATKTDGLYIRAGRFMPVFGLRLAEHTAYTRRFGQTPLYGEAYGVAVAYIEPSWELHVTGFAHDPLQDSTEPGNGGAGYGEVRFVNNASVGLETRYAASSDDTRLVGGATAKYWLESANLLFEGEVQFNHQTFTAGGRRNQVVSYLLGTWFFHDGFMLDIGIGQFDEDLHINNVDLEGVDANVHWFATSHWEILFTNRIQSIALGAGGRTSGYSLVQLHYRL
jgi:hypothetical protein